jgi:hypothetical protein
MSMPLPVDGAMFDGVCKRFGRRTDCAADLLAFCC